MQAPKDTKSNTFLYIISTLTFIFLGIILTSVIDQTKSKDVRTRASATAGIEATAMITEVDNETRSITVNNLLFASSPNKNLGTWVMTPPSSFLLHSVISGNTISILIDANSFDIVNHTLTVKEIKKK
jgi:hypothetical protein